MNQEELQGLIQVAQSMHTIMVERELGESGVVGLEKILELLRDLYRRVSPELYKGRIIVCKALDDQLVLGSSSGVLYQSVNLLPDLNQQSAVFQILDNGAFYAWYGGLVDEANIAQNAVVYRFELGKEVFFAGAGSMEVVKVAPAFASNFGIPTYHDLSVALRQYATLMARRTSCKILKAIWFDDKYLFLKVKPEADMRDSLTQYLKSSLGTQAEVRPEQNMDESKPVDIKIEWFMSQKQAIIEIKWLGQSRDKKKLRTKYGPPRANEGAKQLANYLELNKTQAPHYRTHGYLVVFDARRKNLATDSRTLPADDAMFFASSEIGYDPDYSARRSDFAPPVRFFLEPVHA